MELKLMELPEKLRINYINIYALVINIEPFENILFLYTTYWYILIHD